MAKGRKTGGREKGTPNKTTAKQREEAAASGLMPLDYMLSKLRDENASDEDRKWAAEKAAPYVHPRLASVEQKVQADVTHHDAAGIDRPPRQTRDEWMDVAASARPSAQSH